MSYLLIGFGLFILLGLWAMMRALTPFSPGMGSTAPGVLFQSFPNVIPQVQSVSGAAATNAPVLAGMQGKVTYLEGFDLAGGGATAAGFATITITGLAGGTVTLTAAVAAGAAVAAFANGVFSVRFPTPLAGGTVAGTIQTNTNITVSCGSYGAGNTQASCTAYGFNA